MKGWLYELSMIYPCKDAVGLSANSYQASPTYTNHTAPENHALAYPNVDRLHENRNHNDFQHTLSVRGTTP